MTIASTGGTVTLGLYDTQSQLKEKASITYVDNKVDPLQAGHKGYATLAQAQATQSGLTANTVVEVLSDTTEANNGYYLWDGTTLTKTTFSYLVQANNYTDSRYNSLVTETEQFATQAEAAATAANIAGKVYATPSEGVAPVTGVPSGQYFNVRSSSNDNYIDEYLNNAGVPQATGKSYPSSTSVVTKNSITIADGNGSGKNITIFPTYNAIAPDVSASTISGGGNSLQRNMIGYTESVDVFTGDGVNKTFTTTYNTSNATDIDVWLVRADSVLINVTPFSTLTYVGGKTQVLYPKDGHFVNDAGGTNEGTNPAVLPTQKIRLVRKTKNLIAGSNSSYCGIYGGYDNLQIGIMNHQIGAHLRITGGNHNTQLGGSYNVIETGNYHVQLGGSGHTISGESGTGVAMLGGGQNTVTGSSGWIVGGQKTLISGARAGALGSWNSTNSGSDSTIGGQSINNSGGGSFVYGQALTNTGGWVIQSGFQNTNNGNYSFQWGRDNSNTKDYSVTGGRYAVGRTAGARTYSNGRIASNGDAQTSHIPLKAQTTSATSVFASGANGDQTVNIAENSNNLVIVRAVASDIATDDSASFELKFHVKRKGGVTTIIGTPTATQLFADTSATPWNIAGNVSSTLAMFRVSCTGEASKTINWSMSIEVVEVSRV